MALTRTPRGVLILLMELIWLEDFVALAEAGAFSRAARVRNITQPAFSRRIRALETNLGAPLFERTSAGVVLTPAGAALRPGAEDIIRRVRQVARDVRRVGRDEGATLLFAATHALSFTFFPAWMRDLERAGPLGPLRLVSDSLQGCETLMLQGDAHFLLCHHHPAAPDRFTPEQFSSRIVGADTLEPFCAPGPDGAPSWMLETGGDDIPYLAYSPESGLGRILDATVFNRQAAHRLKTTVTSHLAATLRSLARDGRGVAWLPRTLARDDLASGRLVACAGPDWNVEVEIVVVRSTTPQSGAAEVFWSLIA